MGGSVRTAHKGAAYLGNTSMNTSSPLLFTLSTRKATQCLQQGLCTVRSNTWATGFYFQHMEQEDCQALSIVPSICCYKNTAMQSNTLNWKELLPPTCTRAYTHTSNVSRITGHHAGLWQPPQPSAVSHGIITPLQWSPAVIGTGQTARHSSSEELGMLQEPVHLPLQL